jgi:DNA-binding PadR family transcriptional regulator
VTTAAAVGVPTLASPQLREVQVLVRLECFGYLTSAHLEEFVFAGSGLTPQSRTVTTRLILRRLSKRGLVAATPARAGGLGGGSPRPAYRLTESGRRLVDALEGRQRGQRGRARGTLFVGHALMAADVCLAFRRAARAEEGHELSEWESERESAARLESARVVPDARLVYRTPAWEVDAFVEIDLGTERASRFAGKVRDYCAAWRSGSWRAHLPSWPLVLTVTTDGRRAVALRRATEQLLRSQRDAERLIPPAVEFDFTSLPDLLGPSGPLGAVWQVAGREGLQTLITDDEGVPDGGATPLESRSLAVAGTGDPRVKAEEDRP